VATTSQDGHSLRMIQREAEQAEDARNGLRPTREESVMASIQDMSAGRPRVEVAR